MMLGHSQKAYSHNCIMLGQRKNADCRDMIELGQPFSGNPLVGTTRISIPSSLGEIDRLRKLKKNSLVGSQTFAGSCV